VFKKKNGSHILKIICYLYRMNWIFPFKVKEKLELTEARKNIYLNFFETYRHAFCFKNSMLKTLIDVQVLLSSRLLNNI